MLCILYNACEFQSIFYMCVFLILFKCLLDYTTYKEFHFDMNYRSKMNFN